MRPCGGNASRPLLALRSGVLMPVHKVKGGWKWGGHGKVYPTKAQAEKQGRAAYANGYKGKKKPRGK